MRGGDALSLLRALSRNVYYQPLGGAPRFTPREAAGAGPGVRQAPHRESASESIGHASAHRKRTRVKKGRAGLPARLSSRSGFAKGERGTSHSEAFNGANENAFSHKKSPAERTGGKAGTITLGSVDYARNNVPRGGPRCRRLLPVVSKEAAVFM